MNGANSDNVSAENHDDGLRVFQGTVVHSTKNDPLQILDDFVLGVLKTKVTASD